MKTQRPRGSVDRPPAPDTSRRGGGSDDFGDDLVDDVIEENDADRSSAKAVPRGLPKRKSARQPASVAAATTAAIAAKAAAPTPPPTVAKEAIGARTSEPEEARPPAWKAYITYENAFWLGIFILALITRLYDLGPRALHHDESLHAVYGRNLYLGTGYRHDPMMHGPLQFHFIAFMYWLFGATDAASRLASVTSGLFVVMSPLFLRQQMGRVTALICSFLLLVGPSILYFSRMAREDAIFSGMEMIMIVGLWRFVSTRKPGDFYILCAGLSLMFTIKETAFLSLAVLAVFFIFLFAFQAGFAVFLSLLGYLAALGGTALFISSGMKNGTIPKLPDIPNTDPNWDIIAAFAGNFLSHPLVWSVALITLIFAGVLVGLFLSAKGRTLAYAPAPAASSPAPARRLRPSRGVHVAASEVAHGNGHETPPVAEAVPTVGASEEVAGNENTGETARRSGGAASPLWNAGALVPRRDTMFAHYEPGSLPYLLGGLMTRPSVLLIGLAVFSSIFVLLYSVFFTDVPRGILSGMFASLGYWMAQHDVRRGDQPWFYYLLLIPLYQPIAMFFSAAAGIFFSWRGVRWLFERRRDPDTYDEPGLGMFNTDRFVPFARFEAFLPLFLGGWLMGVLIIYSWAGEKMPWLMVHMVRPAIFLASLFIGALVLSLFRMRRERMAEAGLLDGEAPQFGNGSQRGRFAFGANFSLVGALNRVAHANRKLAYDMGPSTVARFSSARGSQAMAPARRQPMARSVRPILSEQEPPWVTWNRPDSVFPFASFLIIFMLLAIAWGLQMAQLIYANNYGSWGVTWVYPVFMLVLVVTYAIWLGVGRALRYLAAGILSVMLLYEFRSAVMLTYRNPDVATELAVYVQTSPDATRAVNELEDYSKFTTGGKDVRIVYDSEVSWPMEWYLGDYPNKQFIGGGAPSQRGEGQAITDIAPVMFLGYNRLNDENIKKDYIAQRYALRWWFAEEWYKNEFLPNQFVKDSNGATVNSPEGKPMEVSPPGQIGGALQTTWLTINQPDLQGTLWKYLLYREPPKSLGSTDFVLFLRKDIAQQWHRLQNRPIPSTDVP